MFASSAIVLSVLPDWALAARRRSTVCCLVRGGRGWGTTSPEEEGKAHDGWGWEEARRGGVDGAPSAMVEKGCPLKTKKRYKHRKRWCHPSLTCNVRVKNKQRSGRFTRPTTATQ